MDKGPLTRRIEAARPQMQVQAIMRQAKADAKVAVAIFESKDGGLLVHRAIEAGVRG